MTKTDVLVLVGPMGVGKTTVGKKLARSLKVPFLDTDSVVVATNGPIENIFAEHGEPVFRSFEEAALSQSIAAPAVVATGGGAVLSELNRQALKAVTVIYLSTDGRHIKSRLKGTKRPLMKNGFDDWVRIYQERKPIYEAVADLTIDTSGQSLSTTVNEIKQKLGL
jgi:shikimate kinase